MLINDNTRRLVTLKTGGIKKGLKAREYAMETFKSSAMGKQLPDELLERITKPANERLRRLLMESIQLTDVVIWDADMSTHFSVINDVPYKQIPSGQRLDYSRLQWMSSKQNYDVNPSALLMEDLRVIVTRMRARGV
jgi:hypothetical protein